MKAEHMMVHLLQMNEDLHNRLFDYVLDRHSISQCEIEHIVEFINYIRSENLKDIDTDRGSNGWSYRECSEY